MIDDFALRPLDATTTADFYELVVERHKKAATILTSNREPAKAMRRSGCPCPATDARPADSSGRRNGAGGWWSVGALEELTHEVCWSLPAECLPRPVVDFCGNFSEPFGAVNGKVCAFREVLPEQPVHILVGAPFPG